MKKNNIKILPILITTLMAGSGTKFLLEKNQKQEQEIIEVKIENNDFAMPIYPQVEIVTTISTPLTTTVTTTNAYENIMFLADIDDRYSLEQINDIIIKYSYYSHIPYQEAIDIIKANINDISTSYNSLEAFIVTTLYETANEQGILNNYCSDDMLEIRSMTRDEQEQIIIETCNSLGINASEKLIVLAIFRWETGNGTSLLCTLYNNYGGIMVSNGEFGRFQTPEYGIYKAVKCMYGHILNSERNLDTTDIYSIVNDMAYAYCPGTANDWANNVFNMTSNIDEYYNGFNTQNSKNLS